MRTSPVVAISDLLRELKANSSQWPAGLMIPILAGSKDSGAFTVSESVVDTVSKYIQRQKIHHQKPTFENEYRELLRLHGIDFDDRYLWD